MTACQGRGAFISTLDAAAFFMLRQPLGKENLQLGMNLPPILAPARPFFGNIHHGKIEHFEQTVIGRKNTLVFGDFPQLTIESLNGICRINQGSDFYGVFEIGCQIYPIISP